MSDSLKINLHILENCNYRCKYCFAHFDQEKLLDVNDWKKVVDNCTKDMAISEFNIAGGEPLLYKNLDRLIEYIASFGIKISIITNGIQITENWIKKFAKYFKTIGLSIDSLSTKTLAALGRCTRSGRYIDFQGLKDRIDTIKAYNSDCQIKINTVVTNLNCNEVLATQLKEIGNISRWKIMRAQKFKNHCFDNSNVIATDAEFVDYVSNNLAELNVIADESDILDTSVSPRFKTGTNSPDVIVENSLKGSYIMIDAKGCLVDNTKNENYTPVIDCTKSNLKSGLQALSFNQVLYSSRYDK